eukprot:353226-Chlamydomonas_euryale.AAC.10
MPRRCRLGGRCSRRRGGICTWGDSADAESSLVQPDAYSHDPDGRKAAGIHDNNSCSWPARLPSLDRVPPAQGSDRRY